MLISDRSRGVLDPVAHEAVRQVRRGLRRTLGTAPRRQAHPLSVAEIRRIVTDIDRSAPQGARDAALVTWLAHRGTHPGPLFTSMRGGLNPDPISGNAIALILKARAESVGLPTERITGHSLRAGHATAAALAGVGVDRIAAQTRHRRIDVLIERYIRPIQALETSSSRDLGL